MVANEATSPPTPPTPPPTGHKRGAAEQAASDGVGAHDAVGERGSQPTKKSRGHRKVPKQHRVGNFRSYYNYRLGHQASGAAAELDPRLTVLEREWFDGKRGLDIGCNSGNLTIAIGKTFAPAYILGVDVDPQLVAQARANLKEIMRGQQVEDAFHAISTDIKSGTAATSERENTSKQNTELQTVEKAPGAETDHVSEDGDSTSAATSGFGQDMPLSFQLWKPPLQNNDKIPKVLGKAALSKTFPYNVVFKREDVAADSHAGKDYDFITCFSVTKWIHLFHGDEGIKRVFRHFYELLAPGGRLLLEPQPWKSYHKRKFTSDVTIANYGKIELRPKDFPSFLTESVGFKSCTFLQVCQTSSNGFKRPIYIVEK